VQTDKHFLCELNSCTHAELLNPAYHLQGKKKVSERNLEKYDSAMPFVCGFQNIWSLRTVSPYYQNEKIIQ
jgi:hypothetical protein